jgi:hypothetical protein
MPPSDPNPDFNYGVLVGKVEMLDARMTRHEDWIGKQVVQINDKLDRMTTQLAQGAGGLKTVQVLWTAIGGASIAAASIAALFHLTSIGH